MEVNENQTPETPAVETPAAEAPATEVVTTEGDGAAPAQAAPAYTVNPSFKVKHLEKKFDDWIIPHIKDADTEKKVRELYEKAHGLDFVKQDREGYQHQLQSFKAREQQEYLPMKQTVEKVVHFRDKGELGAVFDLIGIDQRDVFKWAYAFATKDQAARDAESRAARNGVQAYDAQFQAQDYQSQAAQVAAQYQERELEFISQRPEVASVIQAFDTQRGFGAFKNEVIARGQYYWHTQGKNISVQQAVDEVLSLVRWGQQAPGQANPAPAPQLQAPASPQAQAAKPVIPSIQGKGTSPAKRVYRTMDEINARRKELEQQGA